MGCMMPPSRLVGDKSDPPHTRDTYSTSGTDLPMVPPSLRASINSPTGVLVDSHWTRSFTGSTSGISNM